MNPLLLNLITLLVKDFIRVKLHSLKMANEPTAAWPVRLSNTHTHSSAQPADD